MNKLKIKQKLIIWFLLLVQMIALIFSILGMVKENNVLVTTNKQQSINADKRSTKKPVRDINPYYPNIDISNFGTQNAYAEKIKGNKVYTDSKTKEVQISIKDYAKDKTDFLKMFKTVKFSVSTHWDMGGKSSSIKTSANVITDVVLDIKEGGNSTQVFQQSDGKKANNFVRSTVSQSFNDEKLILKIIIDVSAESKPGGYIYSSGSASTSAKIDSSTTVDKMKKEDENSIKTYIQEQTIAFDSDTSTLLNSSLKNQGLDGRSNLEEIIKQTNEIINKSWVAKGLEDKWNSNSNTNMVIGNITTDNLKNMVTISYIKDDQKIGGEFMILDIKIKVLITLSNDYFSEIWKRIEIKPGKIVDPITNEIKDDVPEFKITKNKKSLYDPNDGVQGTIIFHNSAELIFQAINDEEKLFVNGDEIEVYTRKFYKKLTDDREKENGTSKYLIESEGVKDEANQPFQMTLTVEIRSSTNDLNFKWVGWDPEKNKEQGKLITQNGPDGKPNPLYDPSINPKTGMRNEKVFVNLPDMKFGNNTDRESSNFLFDPIDSEGEKITDPNKKQKGVIAETVVANKGIKSLEKMDLENVDRITRFQLDENFKRTKEKGEDLLEVINNDNYVSLPGLWWYDIILKDQVPKDSWTWNSDGSFKWNSPPNSDVVATRGSTIHKLIYINDGIEAYKKFTDLDFVKNNGDGIVTPLYPSLNNNSNYAIQGKHLTNYLLAKNLISNPDKISSLSYKETIKYWNMYVSEASGTYNGGFDPNDSKVDFQNAVGNPSFKINTSDMGFDPNEDMLRKTKLRIKNKIKQFLDKQGSYVGDEYEKYLTKFRNLMVGQDYKIYSFEKKVGEEPIEVLLDDMDLNDFVQIETESKNVQLILRANPNSWKVKGELEVEINNIKNYDETKVLNLDDLEFDEMRFNFETWTQDQKLNFKKNYITGLVEKIIDENKVVPEYEAEYGFDYFITISGYIGKDIENDVKETDKKIAEFLEKSNKQKLDISIISRGQSYQLEGRTHYTIYNDPTAPTAPEVPEVPGAKGKINLSKTKLESYEFNFTDSPNEVKYKFVENYIINPIQKSVYKLHKGLERNKDYIIALKGYEIDFKDDNEQLEIIRNFLLSTKVDTIEITVIGTRNKELDPMTIGRNQYTIKNTVDDNNIAPIDPNPIPEEPDDGEHDGDKQFNFKKNMWWIISLLVLSIIGTIAIVWFFKNKKDIKIK